MSSPPHDIPISVVGARNENCASVSSSSCTPVRKSVSVCFNRRGERRGEERRGQEQERTGAGGNRSRRGQEQERTGDGRERSKQIFQVRVAHMEATKTKPQTRVTFLCLLLLDKVNRKPII